MYNNNNCYLIGYLNLIGLIFLCSMYDFKLIRNDSQSCVDIRAVLINCDHDDSEGDADMEAGRYQREELYKHSKLEDCRKKLALTVKLTCDSSENIGGEYFHIEHVYDKVSNKRVRLLNPYVLRLRRDLPRQAYPLQLVDIETILKKKEEYSSSDNNELDREHRDIDIRNTAETIAWYKSLDFLKKIKRTKNKRKLEDVLLQPYRGSEAIYEETRNSNINMADDLNLGKQEKEKCNDDNFQSWNRVKRNEHNIIIQNIEEDKMPIRSANDHAEESSKLFPDNILENTQHIQTILDSNASKNVVKGRNREKDKFKSDSHIKRTFNSNSIEENEHNLNLLPDNLDNQVFTLYGIGDPSFWHTINVQLFEKRSDVTGKTVWNDVTRGYSASVGSHSPQFQSKTLALLYRTLDWVEPNEFTFGKMPLCLLVAENDHLADQGLPDDDPDEAKYIIVPEEDILGNVLNKRYTNYTDSSSEKIIDCHKNRIVVRMTRAWFSGGDDENLQIVSLNSQQYLMLPHPRAHRTEIDIEARADDNQLVRVGASGRISIVVSDNTRRTRSMISVQATNTGLAAANFRIVGKDCSPEITSLLKASGRDPLNTEMQLIPPHHTKKYKLEIPVALPVENARCSVALVNEKGAAVAIRDVSIKNNDRCFCVWYCDCVCLSDDPMLQCHELTDSLLVAAGLSKYDRPRSVRNIDDPMYQVRGTSFNIKSFLTCFLSIISVLLVIGFIKGVIGICYTRVAYLWMEDVVKLPRPIDKYQEPWLRYDHVVYDREGWPVHPHTKERDVHVMEYETMLFLNTLLFILLLCVYVSLCIKYTWMILRSLCPKKKDNINTVPTYNTLQMSTRDGKRKRRASCAEPWMTPDAEDLSKEVWLKSDGLPIISENYLRDEVSSSQDSERDEADYVLKQIQKSKESLTKIQNQNSNISNSRK